MHGWVISNPLTIDSIEKEEEEVERIQKIILLRGIIFSMKLKAENLLIIL